MVTSEGLLLLNPDNFDNPPLGIDLEDWVYGKV